MKWLRSPKIPIWTSLPTGMTAADDGRTIKFLADQTAGVVWDLRYRHFQADGVTVNPSSYKWEFVGGPMLTSSATSSAQVNPVTGAWQDLNLPGPDIVAPLSGEYEVAGHAAMTHNGTGNTIAYMGATTVGGTPSDYVQAIVAFGASGGSIGFSIPGFFSFTAGTTYRLRYGASGGAISVLTVGRRIWGIRPKRVG